MLTRKSRLLTRFSIIAFLTLVLAPPIIFPFITNYIDTTNTENRELAKRPDFIPNELLSFPAKYEQYFNDHLPFKKQLVKLNAYISLNLFGELSSDRVLYGKENWLFYKDESDGNPIACYKGTNLLTNNELTEYKDKFLLTRDRLKSYGKDFVLFIAPNKEQIYNEYMPDKIKVVSDFGRADQLVQYLKYNSDLKVVYPYDELIQNKKNYQLYYRNDTHWNELGGFIGSQQLLSTIYNKRMYIDELVIETGKTIKGDLAKIANIQTILSDDYETIVRNYATDISVEEFTKQSKELTGNNSLYEYQSTSTNPETLLIIGDSFRLAMIPYLNKQFRRTYFYHLSYTSNQDIHYSSPDIIVIEVVERSVPVLLMACDKLLESYP